MPQSTACRLSSSNFGEWPPRDFLTLTIGDRTAHWRYLEAPVVPHVVSVLFGIRGGQRSARRAVVRVGAPPALCEFLRHEANGRGPARMQAVEHSNRAIRGDVVRPSDEYFVHREAQDTVGLRRAHLPHPLKISHTPKAPDLYLLNACVVTRRQVGCLVPRSAASRCRPLPFLPGSDVRRVHELARRTVNRTKHRRDDGR